MTTKSLKRIQFEKAKWVPDKYGYPINPEADPICKECGGHGVVDIGETGCMLENCSKCYTNNR
jgi:hypothetical protein